MEDSDEEEDRLLPPSTAELAGLRVKHDTGDLGEGETMILTLADRNILDEKGDLANEGDALENVLLVMPIIWLGVQQALCIDS